MPAYLFKKNPTQNTLTLFQLEGSPCSANEKSLPQCEVNFVSLPQLDGPTPDKRVRMNERKSN